jgi:hypothetical protein
MGAIFLVEIVPWSLKQILQVLVHGRNIPPNALIAGEDKRRPLYIARTFWEVG